MWPRAFMAGPTHIHLANNAADFLYVQQTLLVISSLAIAQDDDRMVRQQGRNRVLSSWTDWLWAPARLVIDFFPIDRHMRVC